MMALLEGLPKTGKSYELVRLTLDYIRDGITVATTMTVDYERLKYLALTKRKHAEVIGNVFKIQDLNDTENFTHGVLIIDEAAAFIHARDWSNMKPATRQKFSQHMHDGLTVWLATIEFETLDPIVRGLLSYCYRIEPADFLWWHRYSVSMFYPSSRKINRNEIQQRHTHVFNKEIFKCYDYHEHERSGVHYMPLMEDYIREKHIRFDRSDFSPV